MSKQPNIMPKTPLESIAKIVQKEFRDQTTRELIEETNILSGKPPRKRSVEIPEDIEFIKNPIYTGFEGRRSIRGVPKQEKKAREQSENPDAWTEAPKESDAFSPVDSEGSIYDDFEDGTPGEAPLSPEESALQLALAIRKGHEKGRPDIDWHLVKLLYVYGGWAFDRIAAECNIAFNLVRLYGRKGRWPEARESYRQEQAQKISEKLALDEDRLRDWQIMKRRQAGVDGLSWFVKAIANLRDDASPEAIAKLGGLLDRMMSSVTGLSPVEQPMGGSSVNVRVDTQVSMPQSSYPPNSPQARLALEWEKKAGESDEIHTKRLAYVIRELYLDCERSGLYQDLLLPADDQRELRLRNRLGISDSVQLLTSHGEVIQ